MIHIKRKYIYISLFFFVTLLLLSDAAFFSFNLDDMLGLSYTLSSEIFILTLMALYCIKIFVWGIPQTLLYISAALILPIGFALVVSLVGVILQLSLGYFVGKTWGRDKVDTFIQKSAKAQSIISKQNKLGASICFVLRFSPLPVGLVNIYLGSMHIKYMHYMLFSLFGHMFMMVFAVVLSYNIIN